MRYRYAEPDETEFRPWWTDTPKLRLVPTVEGRLKAVRRTCYEDVLHRIGGKRPVRVVIYLRAAAGLDTAYWDLTLNDRATKRGWIVGEQRFTDAVGGCLPEFEQACQHTREGRADGILTIRRATVPLDDQAYADRLERMREQTTFLAFLPQVDPTHPRGSSW
ncbi:hypothetical protein ACIPWL_31665 [Streptomyces sp. NPDC090023]|uniref:hypothetical protein n=1 Tax=unclassified Streptomyces TaxID=2593676 RepID=UPI0038059699